MGQNCCHGLYMIQIYTILKKLEFYNYKSNDQLRAIQLSAFQNNILKIVQANCSNKKFIFICYYFIINFYFFVNYINVRK